MASDETDFMKTEYDRIATAYFGLQNQVNEWFKSYLTIIGLPVTILVAIMKLTQNEVDITISTIPNLLAGLLLIVAFLGLFVTVSIVSMRMEMIMYARTINLVRRYFAEGNDNLQKYLALPKTDTKPGFYERKDTLNWQILIMAFIDGLLLTIGIVNITKIDILWNVTIGICFFIIHWLFYILLARQRKKKWNVKFSEDIGKSNY